MKLLRSGQERELGIEARGYRGEVSREAMLHRSRRPEALSLQCLLCVIRGGKVADRRDPSIEGQKVLGASEDGITHKVSCICVSLQCHVGIGCVTVFKVSGEIPEATVCRS